jgi:glucans biosynthesis protein C
MDTKSVARRYDLDWIRIIGILSVFVFHSLRAFNLAEWHIKNATLSMAAQGITNFLDYWIMPVMFVVSGAAVALSMRDGSIRTAGKFLKDKVLRLIVPLIFADFIGGFLQVYIERFSHHQFSGTLFQFLPHYFEGIYGFGGNFALVGNHTWYLFFLFLFCVALLPLFMLLKSRWGKPVVEKVMAFFSFPGLIYLFVIILVLLVKLMGPFAKMLAESINWGLGYYMVFFFGGFLITFNEKATIAITKVRWISLVLAIGLTVITFITGELDELVAWSWVLTFLGFATRYLNITNPFVKYASEAVLPFYILHQTIIICIDFFVVQLPLPIEVKIAIVIVSAFASILVIYEYCVRRSNIVRVLFGMKWIKKEKIITESSMSNANN